MYSLGVFMAYFCRRFIENSKPEPAQVGAISKAQK